VDHSLLLASEKRNVYSSACGGKAIHEIKRKATLVRVISVSSWIASLWSLEILELDSVLTR
jgi:hypothetical protein